MCVCERERERERVMSTITTCTWSVLLLVHSTVQISTLLRSSGQTKLLFDTPLVCTQLAGKQILERLDILQSLKKSCLFPDPRQYNLIRNNKQLSTVDLTEL